jgi:hypothetical protein
VGSGSSSKRSIHCGGARRWRWLLPQIVQKLEQAWFLALRRTALGTSGILRARIGGAIKTSFGLQPVRAARL